MRKLANSSLTTDADLSTVVNRITLICMSEEFRRLQAELCLQFARSGAPDAETQAFHDALFALLNEFEQNSSNVNINGMGGGIGNGMDGDGKGGL
ncbi:MAG TPA: hypothetical protein DHD79_10690 [Firmicutes bacterium]|nr:hypothetical protein [Bacillota bacterium]HAW71557.1 hypothetical protein [Bacillota bacterium]HAZ21399.1 hypothetical protein [Bacillota bacterium]HBE05303.1 hypothetical protein [Bacillota bacterium]HBG43320.1 hypothetical protein [Bacillota bacterium]